MQRKPAIREEALSRVDTGEAVTQIANALGVHRSTIYNWIEKYGEAPPEVLARRAVRKEQFVDKAYDQQETLLDLIVEKAREASLKDTVEAFRVISDKLSHAQGEPTTRHERKTAALSMQEAGPRLERMKDHLRVVGGGQVSDSEHSPE